MHWDQFQCILSTVQHHGKIHYIIYLDAWWWHVQWMLGIDGPSWLRSKLDVDDMIQYPTLPCFPDVQNSIRQGYIIPPRHTPAHPAHPKDGGRAPRTQQGLWRWICSPWKNQYLRCDYVNPDVDMSEDDTSTNLHLFTSRSQGLS